LSDGQGVHAPTSIYTSASLDHVQLAVAGPDLDWLDQLQAELVVLVDELRQTVTGRQLMIEGFRPAQRTERTNGRTLQACRDPAGPASL